VTLPIRSDRLIIRRFTYADIDDIMAFTAHQSVSAEVPNIPWDDREKLFDYVDTQNGYSLFQTGKCFDLAIELKEASKVIGLLTLVSNGKRQAEIGWSLGVEHRGQGLATEAARRLITYAFRACDYHRIFAGTVFTNTRSWALMERLGMRKEAHFVKAHPPSHPGGDWIDTVRYAILAEEWNE
jgi:RimJ/RimL family protein N-acetyltransferase